MLLEGKTWACGLFSPKPTQLQQQTGVGEWVWLGGEGERERWSRYSHLLYKAQR